MLLPRKSQHPLVIRYTALSASGKSTIAGALEQVLTQQRDHSHLLDGDSLRDGQFSNLGFADAGHQQNVQRLGRPLWLAPNRAV